MPIFIDASENRTGTTLPKLTNPVVLPSLSKLIGGDWLISTLRIRPTTKKLLQRHLNRGALIVECKRMKDLPSSLMSKDKRLYQQAARMVSTGAATDQRILLYTGFHAPDNEGLLRIGEYDGQRVRWHGTRWYYDHFQNAATKLKDSGLSRWEGLSSNREIPIWISSKLRHLEEYKTKPIKVVRKKPKPLTQENSLRELRIVKDARNSLIALGDNFGVARATAIFNHCGGSLAWALQFLSNPKNAGVIRGVGKGCFDEFRDKAGLDPGYGLQVLGLGNSQCGEHDIIYWDRDTCPLCEIKAVPE